MKPVAPAVIVCLLPFLLPGVRPAADPVNDCGEHLKRLGSACLLFGRVNRGRMPASLSELCYSGYVTELKVYECPGTKTEILLRKEIDEKSDYVLSSPANGPGVKAVVQDRSAANHGGAGINVYFSDGTVRWQEARGAVPKTTSLPVPRAVAASKVPGLEPPAHSGGFSELKTSVGQSIYLGMRSHPLTRAEAQKLNLSAESGLFVDEVQSASYARVWNLLAGDVLLSIAGTGLLDNADLSRAVAAATPGTRCALNLVRRGAPLQISVPVGNLPRWLTNRGSDVQPLSGGGAEIRDIAFGLDIEQNGSLVRPGNRFAPGTEKIVCVIEYSGAPENCEVLVEWQYGKSVIARSLGVIGGSGRLVCYLFALRGKPFDSGRHSVLVTGIGQQLFATYYVSAGQ